MSEKKPNVFPDQKLVDEANEVGKRIAKQLEEENEIVGDVSINEQAAAEVMRLRTEEQLRLRKEALDRNIQLAKDLDDKRELIYKEEHIPTVSYPQDVNKQLEGISSMVENKQEIKSNIDYINEISQPQMHQAFDVIPLPSLGKLYPNKKKNVKVAYLTTSDENILTSPNLVESGDFLEILINRKLLEPTLRYKDLQPGDRNAIMIWLRATGYGNEYPVQVLDEYNKPFETVIDLSKLKMIELQDEPDVNGEFTFRFENGDSLKFKLLTVGEKDEIIERLEQEKENGIIVNNENKYVLSKQIVSVDGNSDKNFIIDYVNNLRTIYSRKLIEYIDKIDFGIDLRVNIETPGGGSVATFLPLNPNFFWPDA